MLQSKKCVRQKDGEVRLIYKAGQIIKEATTNLLVKTILAIPSLMLSFPVKFRPSANFFMKLLKDTFRKYAPHP